MALHWIDWLIIGIFLLAIVAIGLSYRQRAGQNLEAFFLGNRQLPWYIAGLSMVATTFAADTPLAVTEMVARDGVAGNWLWWNMLAGGMLTTFFFAKLWHRAGVLTEVELIELRYGGRAARWLRGFKAIYLGVLLNVIVIAWVNVAMMSLLQGFFGLERLEAWAYTLLIMLLVGLYSASSGLLGVAMTDVLQFGVAMLGCVVLAVLVLQSERIGGIAGLKAQLPEGSLNVLPRLDGSDGGKGLSLSLAAFVSYMGFQWWSAWYPGAEPGGGGYAAQRMMSTRRPKDAVLATMLFQVAHYCLRPWPWILVALCAVVLYPELAAEGNEKMGYVYAMRDFLPTGLRGLLLAAFLAAYMSTISTQINWGASYLVNDLYARFWRPAAADAELVRASRWATLALLLLGALLTLFVHSVADAWGFLIQCGAGLGLVLILRWYWWRVNVWSEIAGMVAPVLATVGCWHWGISFPESLIPTVLFTTAAWLAATFLSAPERPAILQAFYDKVRPGGAWGRYGRPEDSAHLPYLLLAWLSALLLTYGLLLLIGKVVLQEWAQVPLLLGLVLGSGFGLALALRRDGLLD